MSSPITVYKNEKLLFNASSIQEAVRLLAEHLTKPDAISWKRS